MGRRIWAFAGGAGLGLMTGLWLARRHGRQHRASLFSPRAERRWAALGWLSRHESPATLRLLRDYVRWERHPRLRLRGDKIVRRMERVLREVAP